MSAKAPNDPGVYAFILEGVSVYVGLTQTGLRTRLDHYRRGHERQRTSKRVKGLIATALSEKKRVDVLIAIPPALDWNGLPINTAAQLSILTKKQSEVAGEVAPRPPTQLPNQSHKAATAPFEEHMPSLYELIQNRRNWVYHLRSQCDVVLRRSKERIQKSLPTQYA